MFDELLIDQLVFTFFHFARVKQTNASSFWRSSHRISFCINGKSYGLCYQWTSKWKAERDILL